MSFRWVGDSAELSENQGKAKLTSFGLWDWPLHRRLRGGELGWSSQPKGRFAAGL